MLFNSYVFVLFFLPVCVMGYFALNRLKCYSLAQVFLLGMSLWFYGYFNRTYLLIMLASIVVNYIFSGMLISAKNGIWKKTLLSFAVFGNLAVLFYFKYFDFFLENINYLFRTDFAMQNIMLPLGISFFTFQQLSFVIDSYKGEVLQYGFIQYASFVSFFPQLVAGPIVTHDELIPQFLDESRKQLNWENLAKGIYIFVLGMAKKVLIADIFGNAANWGFENFEGLSTTNTILAVLCYTIQIYFDFSGYCDMAIGMAKMMNIDLPLNFNSPYKAKTITEFWDRWHMTLTRFFTRYVYIPLGGSRKGTGRTYLNVLVVFLVSGLWHGANWTFVLWGFLHGLFSVIHRRFRTAFDKLPPVVNWIITFAFINLTWMLFRADSVADAMLMLKQILCFDIGLPTNGIYNAFALTEFYALYKIIPGLSDYRFVFFPIYLLIALYYMIFSKNAYEKMQDFQPSLLKIGYCVFLLVWSVMSFSSVSTFLYFNF